MSVVGPGRCSMLGKRLRIRRSIGWLFGCLVWFGFVLVLVWWRLYCSSPILSRIRAEDLLFFLNFVTYSFVRCSPQPGVEAESIGGALLPLLLLLVLFSWLGSWKVGERVKEELNGPKEHHATTFTATTPLLPTIDPMFPHLLNGLR